jgi:hypothetical protein
MHDIYADTTHDNRNNASANNLSKPQTNNEYGFADNRPETIAQRKMQQAVTDYISGRPTQLNKHYAPGSNSSVSPVSIEAGNVMQRKVQVDNDIYESGKRNYGIKAIVDRVKANQGNVDLPHGWITKLENHVKDKAIQPRKFVDLDDLINYLAASNKKRKISPTKKYEEQDVRIQGLNTSYGDDEFKYGNILSYESGKAFSNVTGQVEEMQEYKDTVTQVEGFTPGIRSTTNDFTHSNYPFIHLQALRKSNLNRLDYMGVNNVQVDTYGYDSKKDRSVDPHTLSSNNGYGVMKIGPNISSYMKEMKTDVKPNQDQMNYLTPLEMHRFPEQGPNIGMKRDLYEKDEFTKNQGLGYNHNHSNVEFKGAISGTKKKSRDENMRRQQTMSNYSILETAFNLCPDVKIGDVNIKKALATAKDEMNALVRLVTLMENKKSKQEDLDRAKKDLRKVLVRILRGTTRIEALESDSDDFSDFNESHYQ